MLVFYFNIGDIGVQLCLVSATRFVFRETVELGLSVPVKDSWYAQ